MLNPILLQLAQEKVAIRKDEQPQPPPNYRLAFGETAKCQGCKHYTGGHCKKFKVPVDPNFVCDEYEPVALDFPEPAAIDPGGGLMLPAPAPVSPGEGEVKLGTDGLDSITPQLDQGPVVAAPLKSNKRTESGSPNPSDDESSAAKDTYRHPEQPEHDVNNNPNAIAKIFGMATKAAMGGGGGGGSGGGAGGGSSGASAGGGMAAPSSGESTGVSAPQGYGPYPDQQQIHRLQVGFSGSRRKRCKPGDTICKAAGLLDMGLSAAERVGDIAGTHLPSLMHEGPESAGIGLTDSPRLAAFKNLRAWLKGSGRMGTGDFERGLMRDTANTQRLQQGLALGGAGLAAAGLGYGAYRLLKGKAPESQEDQTKSAAPMAGSINPAGLTPNVVKSMPNAAQSVPIPQARPLVGAQPGDPSMNPGPPAGPRGTPSQPTGQQGQASPTPPPQQQPAPQQPAPQGPAPSPLVTLYPQHPAIQTYAKFVPPAPPPDGGGQQKMAGEIDLESLATVAASIKVASVAPAQPPKPRSPVAPVPPSAPKKPSQPTIKAAKSVGAPSARSLARKSLTGKAMQAKNLTPKNLNKQGAAEERAVRAGGAPQYERDDDDAVKLAGVGNNAVKSAGVGASTVKSAAATDSKSTDVYDENNARLGVAVTVTRSLPLYTEKVARRMYSKRANLNVALPTLPFDPLSHDLTTPADMTALAASGGVGKQHGLMERASVGKGKHPGIKGKSPGRSTGFLDPATMAQVRQATGGARTALDLDIKPSAQSFFDNNRFQTLAQMASVGDARAYSQMQDMLKSLNDTGTDPYTARMAQSRLQDLELQHPQFAKTSQVINLAELASRNLLKSAAVQSQMLPPHEAARLDDKLRAQLASGVPDPGSARSLAQLKQQGWSSIIGGSPDWSKHESMAPRQKAAPPAPKPQPSGPLKDASLPSLINMLFPGKPSTTDVLQQLRGSQAAKPSVSQHAPTVAYKAPAVKLANIVKSAQGRYGVHPDPRVRLQQQMAAAQGQGGQPGANVPAGEPGSTQAGPPSAEQQEMQQKYQQLRQSGRMPRNMTYQRWSQSWQQSGDRLAKAEAERQANPELQRRPEERGAAGFDAWQGRMRQHRQNLKQMTPEEAKQMERQPNESVESWTNRRGNIASGLQGSQQNRAQQVTNRQGIMNVQGRVNAMTPEQKTQMADAETMRALQAQGLTPEQAKAKMQTMTPEQRGQMNEQAANQQANTYNQMEAARAAEDRKTPEQRQNEENEGLFNTWQNHMVDQQAKAMGYSGAQDPELINQPGMNNQKFQQMFQQQQQAGSLQNPDVMTQLQQTYKDLGYHGQMPAAGAAYSAQAWTQMNTPAQQGTGTTNAAAPAPGATPPVAGGTPPVTPTPTGTGTPAPTGTGAPTGTPAPTGTGTPPAGNNAGGAATTNANTGTATTTTPTTTATNPTATPTGTGGTNTGGATNTNTNANANAPKAEEKKPGGGGFSVGNNPSPNPGSESGQTPYSK